MMKRHGWRLRALPTSRPASRMRSVTPSGTSAPEYARESRLLATASRTSIRARLDDRRLAARAARDGGLDRGPGPHRVRDAERRPPHRLAAAGLALAVEGGA